MTSFRVWRHARAVAAWPHGRSAVTTRKAAMLTKQQVIMHHILGTVTPHTFAEVVDDEGAPERRINLIHADWEAMGSPATITVTIEPGDLLNEAST